MDNTQQAGHRHTQTGAGQETALGPRPGDFGPPPEIPGYELLSCIGGGGFGRVYKARQVSLDRIVAVKILHDWLTTEPGFRNRFLMEGQVLARLEHRHIVKVIEIGGDEQAMWMVSISPSLDRMVMASMRADPDKRPQRAKTFLKVFQSSATARKLRLLFPLGLLCLVGGGWLLVPTSKRQSQPPQNMELLLQGVLPLDADEAWNNASGAKQSYVENRFGRPDAALNLSGENRYLKASLPILDTVSVSLWLRIPEPGGRDGTLLDMAPSYLIDLAGRGLRIRTRSGTQNPDAAWQTELQIEDVFTPGQWHHMVWGRDSETGRQVLYVDRERIENRQLAPGAWPVTRYGQYLGARYTADKTLESLPITLDDLRFYGDILSPQSVETLFRESDRQPEEPAGKAEAAVVLDFEAGLLDEKGVEHLGVSTTLVEGPDGIALEFDGDRSRLDLALNFAELGRTDGFSMAMDVQSLDQISTNQIVATCGGPDSGFHLIYNHPRAPRCYTVHLIGPDGQRKTMSSAPRGPYDLWDHVALTWQEGDRQPRFYYNGQEMIGDPVDGFPGRKVVWPSEPSPLTIGGGPALGEIPECGFKGRIDNLHIFKGVLSAPQVRTLTTKCKTCRQRP